MTAEEIPIESEDGAGGPGAPTPLSALEVCYSDAAIQDADCYQKGVAGLTPRDIKLIVDGGYHTVEAVAYTLVIHADVARGSPLIRRADPDAY